MFQLQATFAALQESTQNVYNPVKFAESLKLSTSEQQDAQELVLFQARPSHAEHSCRFSKLFMSHLDNEFQKQLNPSLRTLISDQAGHVVSLVIIPLISMAVSRAIGVWDPLSQLPSQIRAYIRLSGTRDQYRGESAFLRHTTILYDRL